MARYIVIDNVTGRIVGDTMRFSPANSTYEDPFTACRDIDDENGISNRENHEQTQPFSKGEPGYLVYRGDDETGRLFVPLITDFADKTQIEAVRKRERIERFLAANGVEIAGVEFIADNSGRLLVYDVNTNTNYNAEAEAREGRTGTSRSGPGAIAQFLEAEPDRLQAEAA